MANTSNDEAFARALQEQFQNEAAVVASLDVPSAPPVPPPAQPQIVQESRSVTDFNLPPESAPTYMNDPVISDSGFREDVGVVYEDEEYARQVEQELRDEELARNLQAQAQAEVSAGVGDSAVIVPPEPPAKRCTTRRVLSSCCSLAVIAGGVIAAMVVFGGGGENGPLGNIPGVPDFWPDDDPWSNADPDDANKWDNGPGGGLELTILNALEDRWHPFFYQAVEDWDNGSPDALTLTMTRVPYEYNCKASTGEMKVCNGNYGQTEWRGVNEVLLKGGYIISSTAKMNDHYLDDAGDAQSQYTMCHEIGHGFGLPHTDENFYNADLGNCMDYTQNPENNETPDESNYLRLEELYGAVGRRRFLLDMDGEIVAGALNRTGYNTPRSVMEMYEDAISEFHSSAVDNGVGDNGSGIVSDWTVLQQSPHGEVHMLDLGGGYKAAVHKLLR